jgi:alkylhydroperoxidase family enzyme
VRRTAGEKRRSARRFRESKILEIARVAGRLNAFQRFDNGLDVEIAR